MTVPNYKWVQIGKARITSLTFQEAVRSILLLAEKRNSEYIVTPNTDHILQLESTPLLRSAYDQAKLVVCDGRPILWASYLLRNPLPDVITGADLMPALCKEAASMDLRIALVGGPPGTAEKAGENLKRKYPGLTLAWTHCPPFGFEKSPTETDQIIRRLNELDVDLVFLGVGAPKQEIWIHQNRGRLKVGVLLGIGAAIEFMAETLPRAPKLMRRLGLEWVFRLYHDPKRLALRYLKDLYFVVIVARQILKKLI